MLSILSIGTFYFRKLGFGAHPLLLRLSFVMLDLLGFIMTTRFFGLVKGSTRGSIRTVVVCLSFAPADPLY